MERRKEIERVREEKEKEGKGKRKGKDGVLIGLLGWEDSSVGNRLEDL